MKIFLIIILILIIVAVILAGLAFLFVWFIKAILTAGLYAVGGGMAYQAKAEQSAWDYWETIKSKKWDELTSEEQEKCVSAVMAIYNDVGVCSTEEAVKQMLIERLPVLEPHVGPPSPLPAI